MPSSPPRAAPSGLGGRDRLQPRSGALPHRRAARGPARRSSSTRSCSRPRRVRRGRRPRRWTRRSTAGSGTPAGPTSSPRSPATATPSPGRTSTSPCPSRPASSAIIAPQDVGARSGFVSASSRPPSSRATPSVVVATQRLPALGDHASPRCSRRATCPGVVNVLTGSPAELAPWLASHADVQRARPRRRGRARLGRPADRGGRHPQARRLARAGADAAAPSRSTASRAFTETKTVWHPKSLV